MLEKMKKLFLEYFSFKIILKDFLYFTVFMVVYYFNA